MAYCCKYDENPLVIGDIDPKAIAASLEPKKRVLGKRMADGEHPMILLQEGH